MNEGLASIFSYLMAYGFFLGVPIFCYIIHRTKALELGVIISLCVFLMCCLLIKIGVFSVGALSIILWILGFFSSSQLIIFYAALFTVPYRHSCLSVSIVNMFVTISIMLFHFYVAFTTQYEREIYFFYDPMKLLILFFSAMLIYLTYLYKRGKLSFIN